MQLSDLERKTKIILKKKLKIEEFKEISKKLRFFLTKDETLGDYSTNLLFLLEKINPQLKEPLLEEIKIKFDKDFEKIEVKDGYLNFYLSNFALFKDLRNLIKKREKIFFVKTKKQKVILDYISANPTGPLHIGNIRSAVLGDLLANFMKLLGFRVTKEYYVNDRGNQIETLAKSAKAFCGLISFEENFYKGDYLEKIASEYEKKIKKEEDLEKLGKFLGDIILERIIKKSLKNLGTFFDNFFFETDLYKDDKFVQKIIKAYEKRDLLEKRNGALILSLSKLGEIKDEYLIRDNGKPTYFFSDILYHAHKFFIRKYLLIIDIFGADHQDHVRRLKKALEILGIKEKNLKFLVYQHVLLKKEEELVKMSKRKGTYITIDNLLSIVPRDIVRFMFSGITPEVVLGFDLELALKKTLENPYWYVEYAYARMNSILEKLKEINYQININIDPQKAAEHLIKNEEIKSLMKSIHKFNDLKQIIVREFKPNLFYDFLLSFSKKIHHFYENKKIIKEEIDRREVVFVKVILDTLGFWLKLMNIEPMKKI